MNGIERILDLLQTTQQTKETLVHRDAFGSQEGKGHYSSADERPKTERCAKCGRNSGNLSAVQKEWMDEMVNRFKTQQSAPIWVHPDGQQLFEKPSLEKYLRKPFVYWNPLKNFNINLERATCYKCGRTGCLKTKEMSSYRHVHGLQSDVYLVSAVLACRNCKCSFSCLDERAMKGVLPVGLFMQLPVKCFKRSSWTSQLVDMLVDLCESNCSISHFLKIVSRSRTSTYLKAACLYKAHVEHWVNSEASFFQRDAESRSHAQFDPFPSFLQHCGYNSTLGPSHFAASDVFVDYVTTLKPFLVRVMNGKLTFS